MKRSLLLIALVFTACSSTHKLSETSYQDLSSGSVVQGNPAFPSEVEEAVGWGDITEGKFKKGQEEMRFNLSSDSEPYHLFRITNRKKVGGEVILYWEKEDIVKSERMKDFMNGRCEEILETQSYEYCVPLYVEEPNWQLLYNSLESSNVWTVSDQHAITTDSLDQNSYWKIDVELRVKNFYRSYEHISPDQYQDVEAGKLATNIAGRLNTMTYNFLTAENFDTYSGITNGKPGSDFIECNKNEVWRFNGSLQKLIERSGYPVALEEQENMYFYITVQGTIREIWHSNRGKSGAVKNLYPSEINNISVVSSGTCSEI